MAGQPLFGTRYGAIQLQPIGIRCTAILFVKPHLPPKKSQPRTFPFPYIDRPESKSLTFFPLLPHLFLKSTVFDKIFYSSLFSKDSLFPIIFPSSSHHTSHTSTAIMVQTNGVSHHNQGTFLFTVRWPFSTRQQNLFTDHFL